MDEYNFEESRLIRIAEKMYRELKEMPGRREARITGADPAEIEIVRRRLLGMIYSDTRPDLFVEEIFNPERIVLL